MGTSFYNKDSIDELFLCVALNITICLIEKRLLRYLISNYVIIDLSNMDI